jgi:hypothetical protein
MSETLSDKWHFGDELLESGDRYYTEKDIAEFIQTIIKRCCRPNKPINTFKYAREIEEIILEEAGSKFKEKQQEKKDE